MSLSSQNWTSPGVHSKTAVCQPEARAEVVQKASCVPGTPDAEGAGAGGGAAAGAGLAGAPRRMPRRISAALRARL